MNEERERLFFNIRMVKNRLKELGFDTGNSESQIIPVIVGSEEETLKLSEFLENEGIWASAIRPPTVEQGASRIRITITLNHTEEDIRHLLNALEAWKEQ